MKYRSFVEAIPGAKHQGGAEWLILCPFHGDRTPSMTVNADRGLYHCFSCGVGGKIDRLAEKLRLQIGSTANAESVLNSIREARKDPNEEVVKRYPEAWLDQFKCDDMPYWRHRGFSGWAIKAFDLGYDPFEDAAVIPLRDRGGFVIGVIRRMLDPNAKPRYRYPNGFERTRFVFGGFMAKKERKDIVIVEGSLDAVAMWDAGFPSIAILGSTMSPQQAAMVRQLNPTSFVIATDNDEAGDRAARSIRKKLRGSAPLYMARYEGALGRCKDPGDMSVKERWKLVERATPIQDRTSAQVR